MKRNCTTANQEKARLAKMKIATKPYIAIEEGVKFYSDRFYLNAPTGLPYYKHDEQMMNEKKQNESKDQKCGCPPPLFDRARLIQSLDLKAALVGTYTLDIDWMSREIPSLFPSLDRDENAMLKQEQEQREIGSYESIPTLLLHGHQGLKNELLRSSKQKQRDQSKMKSSSSDHDRQRSKAASKGKANNLITVEDHSDGVKTKKEKDLSQKKRKKRKRLSMETFTTTAKRLGKKIFLEPDFTARSENKSKPKYIASTLKNENCDRIENFQTKRRFVMTKETIEDKKWKDELQIFQPSVHVTQILPQWKPPQATKSIEKNPKIKEMKEVEKEEVKRCMGTYHPKFMLLFEQSGSLVVVVSTANLTRPRGVDGTWLQRFYPIDQSSPRGMNGRVLNGTCDGSDFGHVLCDFLQRQDDAAEENSMRPSDFLKRYMGISSLTELQQRYAFEKASVHLVSTVPGSYPGRFGGQHLGKLPGVKAGRYDKRIFYGPQRISDVMHKCTHRMNPWLPRKYLSKADKLVVQTTSFGSKWKRQHLQHLVQQYLGVDDITSRSSSGDRNVLTNLDIVWPTKRLMDEIEQEVKQECQKCESKDNLFEHFTFLSSEAFNSIDEVCISRMTKYQNQRPLLLPHALSPHIKSYARIINGEKAPYKSHKGETSLAWFMLTSACLSRGAQGQAEREQRFQGIDDHSYLNFELGVLFCSRLQGNPTTDRLYKCYPDRSSLASSCNNNDGNCIYLPIPFRMKSKLYQPFQDIPDFDDDPFFHEVTKTSVIKGNMGYTPLGKRMSKEYSS